MKLKSKFYYISFELNNDRNNRDFDDKEVEELSLLAYLEAKTKILEQSRNEHSGHNNNNSSSSDRKKQEVKKKLFSTAPGVNDGSAQNEQINKSDPFFRKMAIG